MQSKHAYVIEYLRQRLEQLDDQAKTAEAARDSAQRTIATATQSLMLIAAQRQEINASIAALKADEQRDMLARPHQPQAAIFHPTHKVETRVMTTVPTSIGGGGTSEVTFCIPCGAGKPGSLRRPTDPCCMHRDQDDHLIYDDHGASQPLVHHNV